MLEVVFFCFLLWFFALIGVQICGKLVILPYVIEFGMLGVLVMRVEPLNLTSHNLYNEHFLSRQKRTRFQLACDAPTSFPLFIPFIHTFSIFFFTKTRCVNYACLITRVHSPTKNREQVNPIAISPTEENISHIGIYRISLILLLFQK